ncbi:uncharacterized protein HVO_2219 [Haloferax volcanii DS2]|uniref:Uncharacterized protein n=1 Tax=Haloferax volcanii (strain ATCC 29605 / DSM 3757 / JCM 8879 / NBRC 14742 / NCIMB 2012 / VKM B-1768 / DS2) TaxID=309800 RepID=D4GVT5_HALVD|nr:uncharacterized protein HVO_2219 [Haloferax volcanii DS2]
MTGTVSIDDSCDGSIPLLRDTTDRIRYARLLSLGFEARQAGFDRCTRSSRRLAGSGARRRRATDSAKTTAR